LKKMTLSSDTTSLTHLSPGIVAGAAVKLEELEIRSQLLSVQLEAILTRGAGSQDSKLRKLVTISYQTADISGMDPDILSQVLIKLETVGDLVGLKVKLSPDQVLALFSRIRESPVSTVQPH